MKEYINDKLPVLTINRNLNNNNNNNQIKSYNNSVSPVSKKTSILDFLNSPHKSSQKPNFDLLNQNMKQQTSIQFEKQYGNKHNTNGIYSPDLMLQKFKGV